MLKSFIQGEASCKTEKSLWQFLRSLGVNVDSSTKHFDSRFSLNDLNRHFVTPPVNIDPTHKQDVIDNILAQPNPTHSAFRFQEVSCEDIRRAFFSIKSNACGTDDLSIRFLKPVLNSFNRYYQLFFIIWLFPSTMENWSYCSSAQDF
uniref:Reverse transcriptase n=1 Tax=Cacopsylla melanoneura TaxID=428564 RepID=A0A8D8U377_9HEMI